MDGTLGVIFILWALLGLEGDKPFERVPADPAWVFAPGHTMVDEEDNGFEFRISRLRDHRFGPLQPMFDLSVSEDGGVYVGSGFHQEMDLFGPVYFAGSGVTGLWFEGDDQDLGGLLQFRTTFELGVEFRNDSRLGIAWDHRSNAGINGPFNPGMENVSIRYLMRF